jgi:LmbE family N-acetylglucosaminyl deacetylase
MSRVVFVSDERRERGARRSAEPVLVGVKKKDVVARSFRYGFLPSHGVEIKEYFEELKTRVSPDAVFTHYRSDLHQDHRPISELTWNTLRDHLIFEYEIPKYYGDFGSPSVFVELGEGVAARNVRNLLESFESQREKRWFSEDLFRSVLRIRGMDCNAASGVAEGFDCRKLVMG